MQVLSLFSYLLCVTFLISRKNTLGIYADVTLLSTIDISTQKQLPGKTAEMLKFNREQQMGMTH